IGYLHAIQNKDGGFPAQAGDQSNPGTSCWAVMALAAAGEDITGKAWSPAGLNPVNYLNNCNISLESTNDYARLLLALSAAGQGPVFRNKNLADQIAAFQQKDGQFAQPVLKENSFINSHLWSVLALASAGYQIPNQGLAKTWLLERQNKDGGFGWAQGEASDSDDTGIAVQALALLGEDPQTSPAIRDAVNYLKSCQDDDGGFNSGSEWMSSGSNASSSAWVLQGLIAAGENTLAEQWAKNGNSPESYLLNLQNELGFYNWKTDVVSSPVVTTAQTIMALAQKPFPVNKKYYHAQNLPAENSGFSDLNSSYWAYQPIVSLVQTGVLSGYPDGTFKPEKKVSRAESARYLVCGLGLQDMNTGAVHDFPDVYKNYWAYQYISIAAQKGYITGMPDGTFNPGGEISGAQLAVMLVKALPYEKTVQIQAGSLWYSGYVEYAQKAGLLYPDFQPAGTVSRAQCAYSIMQLRNIINTR
ncbi:MAG TPA: S-layer homology domain-containing protein, partial [Syntrophomonadaceae bacterium]|nr:S-layer homology domain-containing protein [Syntrophomonadaceae bacterium]